MKGEGFPEQKRGTWLVGRQLARLEQGRSQSVCVLEIGPSWGSRVYDLGFMVLEFGPSWGFGHVRLEIFGN